MVCGYAVRQVKGLLHISANMHISRDKETDTEGGQSRGSQIIDISLWLEDPPCFVTQINQFPFKYFCKYLFSVPCSVFLFLSKYKNATKILHLLTLGVGAVCSAQHDDLRCIFKIFSPLEEFFPVVKATVCGL